MNQTYQEFIAKKSQLGESSGFEPNFLPDFLFDFQKHLVEWAVRKGRAAIFADCGLGKTPIQLVWAENVVRKTNRPVLILTPLAVSQQTKREGDKFGIECHVSRDGEVKPNITVTNYERLHYFDSSKFGGVVCDESSCVKAMDGKRRAEVTEFLRTVGYRLFCTATAAPNDYVELGTSSEALGYMGQRDMITMFFKQATQKDHLGWGRTKYLLKGHASGSFWKWVCSWARACRKPSDLGYSDEAFILPELKEVVHVVEAKTLAPGFLFSLPATNMQEERAERRRTLQERCEQVAEIVNRTDGPFVIWCHLNDEGTALTKLIQGSEEVSGSTSHDKREEVYEAFSSGKLKRLVIKPKVGAYGLNWQFCNNIATFASHSFEQYYQAVRRCWRFGQKKPVTVHIVASEGEEGVFGNLKTKSLAADAMFSELVANMNEHLSIKRNNQFTEVATAPNWLGIKEVPS